MRETPGARSQLNGVKTVQKYNDESAKQKVLESLHQFEVALAEMGKGVAQLREAVERDWTPAASNGEGVK